MRTADVDSSRYTSEMFKDGIGSSSPPPSHSQCEYTTANIPYTFLEPFRLALILRGMSKDETIDGSKIAALILSRMPAKDQERIMSSIQAKSPSIAAKLEDSLFNFERIAQLNDLAVQDLLKEIPHRDIVISLKAAPERVKEKLLENMSESKQRMVEDDFSTLPPMRISDVQAAQRRILKKLEELYPEGGIGNNQRSVLPRLA